MVKVSRDVSRMLAASLLASLTLVACSPSFERGETASAGNGSGGPPASAPQSPPSQSPSRTDASAAAPAAQETEPLEIPARVASGAVTEHGGGWNKAVQRITYPSSADDTRQPMMFYKPQAGGPRPLLVGLHSWSEGYTQDESAIYAEWAIANDWVFIHPHFRGPNVKPQATGSELVIADVLSAIDYARENAAVDERRIYAIGWSGGGHLGLLLAGRHPDIWAGVSAWVPVTDLNLWYEESRRLGTRYARQIQSSCGGRPTGGTKAAAECRERSPVTHLEHARDVPLDIAHGIHDGQSTADPVPITQSLRAFNVLAAPEDRFTDDEIDTFSRDRQVPAHLRGTGPSSLRGGVKTLFQRQSGNARLTVFDGAHEKHTEAAVRWLNEQRKR